MRKYNFIKFRTNKIYYFLIIFTFTILSCESDYSKLVKKELSTGVKNDSLFFGMKFNDTKKEFFATCQQLNNEKLVSHGPNNQFVEYTMKANEDDESSIQMLFYGMFNEEQIMTGMNMRFSYNAWAPWNTDLNAEKLIPSVKDTLQKWFPGNEFMKVNLKKLNKDTFIKIDGNRQIKLYILDDKHLTVRIEDLDKKSEYNDHSK